MTEVKTYYNSWYLSNVNGLEQQFSIQVRLYSQTAE